MVRGQESKNIIQNKILEVFSNSFIYGKEIRIPIVEEGEEIQIKVTLTAAKTNVMQGEDSALPGDNKQDMPAAAIQNTVEPSIVEISQEEKDNIQNLLKSIGL